MALFDTHEIRIVLALAIGLLIGTERERRRGDADFAAFAGVRTFGLVALFGGLLAYLGNVPLLAVGAGGIALMTCIAYVVHRDHADRGLTTEVAVMVTFALGVTAVRHPATAASIGVLMTALLALRSTLHRAVRDLLTAAELRDGLLLLVFALVLLPIAPDVHVGPYGALHPPSLVRLVVVMMLTNGLGHLAQRLLGARFGLLVAGLTGGFVSSSATIAAMSMRAKESPARYRGMVAGALASCVATSVQYLLMVGTVDVPLMRALLPGLLLAAVVALLMALMFSTRSNEEAAVEPATHRPFRLRAALVFVAVYAAVAIGSAALHARLGSSGALLVYGLAGAVDAHATAGPIAAMHGAGELDMRSAVIASLAALSTNTAMKVVMAWSGRHLRFGVATTACALMIAACTWVSLLALTGW